MKQQRLGKGLGALIGDVPETTETKPQGLMEVDVNDIDPNAAQPRKHFDNEKLMELAQSIKTHGVVQPIIVQKNGSRYTIIAGERRYRASRMAGLKKVPVVVKEISFAELMEISLVENLQREDLNPIEEAQAMRLLMDEYKLTQEELSTRLGKSRSAVANTLRLLSLPESVCSLLISGELTSGHARCLVALESDEEKIAIAEKIVAQGLSVRETEALIRDRNKPKVKPEKKKNYLPEIEEAQKSLAHALGTRVKISGDLNQGKITLAYYNKEQLQALYDFLMTCE